MYQELSSALCFLQSFTPPHELSILAYSPFTVEKIEAQRRKQLTKVRQQGDSRAGAKAGCLPPSLWFTRCALILPS